MALRGGVDSVTRLPSPEGLDAVDHSILHSYPKGTICDYSVIVINFQAAILSRTDQSIKNSIKTHPIHGKAKAAFLTSRFGGRLRTGMTRHNAIKIAIEQRRKKAVEARQHAYFNARGNFKGLLLQSP